MRFRCISKLGNLQAYFSTLVSFEIHEWRTLFSNIQLGPSMQACVNDVPWKDPLKRQFRDTQWRDLIGFLQWKDPAGSFQVSSHSKGSFRKVFPLFIPWDTISQEKNTHGKTQRVFRCTVTSLTVPTVHTYCKQVATKLFKCTLNQRFLMQKAAIFEKKSTSILSLRNDWNRICDCIRSRHVGIPKIYPPMNPIWRCAHLH